MFWLRITTPRLHGAVACPPPLSYCWWSGIQNSLAFLACSVCSLETGRMRNCTAKPWSPCGYFSAVPSLYTADDVRKTASGLPKNREWCILCHVHRSWPPRFAWCLSGISAICKSCSSCLYVLSTDKHWMNWSSYHFFHHPTIWLTSISSSSYCKSREGTRCQPLYSMTLHIQQVSSLSSLGGIAEALGFTGRQEGCPTHSMSRNGRYPGSTSWLPGPEALEKESVERAWRQFWLFSS